MGVVLQSDDADTAKARTAFGSKSILVGRGRNTPIGEAAKSPGGVAATRWGDRERPTAGQTWDGPPAPRGRGH